MSKELLKRIKENDEEYLLKEGCYSSEADVVSLGLLDDAADAILYYMEDVKAMYTEAELQEKLRQQRIACADVWVSECYEDNKCTDVGKFMYEAILNAAIDNSGEEGG